MSFYTRQIFPRVMEASLSTPENMGLRRTILAAARGEVLEIGIGGGLNLACYPPDVRRITAVDVHPQLLNTAAERARQAGMAVDFLPISAERLPFSDAQFDSVISTWTLCSIPNVSQALEEIRRVLKPDGRFYFLEHGLSPNTWVRFWQNCFNPFQKMIAAGCYLNRDIPALIQQAGLTILDLKTFYTSELPRTHSYSFLGTARKGNPT